MKNLGYASKSCAHSQVNTRWLRRRYAAGHAERYLPTHAEQCPICRTCVVCMVLCFVSCLYVFYSMRGSTHDDSLGPAHVCTTS
jgi:hypothetical protein